MLAVQRPMMGSSKLPHMQFGYDIDSTNSHYSIPSPPPLVSGPSLLDDSDTRFLDNFFDGVSSDQYIDPTETWNYEWTDLPPDFLGTQTSFGQQPEPPTNDVQHLTFPEFKNPLGVVPIYDQGPPPPPPPPQVPQHDVISPSYMHNGHHSNDFLAPAVTQASPMPSPYNPYIMQQNDFAPQLRRMSKPNTLLRHASMSEAMYGAPYSNFSPSQTINKKVEIKWGTDSGFASGRGFVPPPNAITQDDIDECIASTLECFQPGSNVSTRPSSPVAQKIPPYERRLDSITETNGEAEDSNKSKRKKSKGKVKDDDYEDEEENGTTKNGRKRRGKSMGGGDGDAPQKRRKSSASNAPKMARENLTEDQKRENHIKSEQKRRTLIKEGFEDLNELVPDLRGGGFSKSAVLIMAADWLEDLINGNNALKQQLAELEGRNGI